MNTDKVPVTKAEKARGVSQVALIFACGTALFSDGYANGVIGSVNTMLTTLYPTYFAIGSPGAHYSQTFSSLVFAGTVVGMLVFGYLSDKLGRKAGMITATVIVAIFSALSAGSYAGGTVAGIVATLSAYRFLLGIGIGAEYPCGSVAASEQSEDPAISQKAQHRWFALATNCAIDWGFVVAAFVPLVLLWIFGLNHLRAVWRISLGLGVVPAMLVFIWRLKMTESRRFSRDSMKHAKTPYLLIFKRYWKSLVAICLTWFIYDFITYPFGIYSSTVVNSINKDSSLYATFGWNVVINLFYIPGCMGGAFCIDYLGPKYTMITGLLLQALFGFFMSGFYVQLENHIAGFAVMYGLFLSFGEFGPGNNLGLLAAKTGPTAFRGQFYGIAAAVGKVGAFVGTWAFPPMIDAFGGSGSTKGNTGPFWVGSGLAILSALITFFFIKPIGHDGMVAEDLAFRVYLQEHGYDTSKMGLVEEAAEPGIVDDVSLGEKEKEGRGNEIYTASAV